MKIVGHITGKSKPWFHGIFCLAVLGLLFAGMYLLYASGFRFSNLVSAVTDCFFFLFCVYTGRWLCGIYIKHKPRQFLLFILPAIAGLAVIKYLLFKYVFDHPGTDFFELSRDVMPFFLMGLVMGMLLKFVRAYLQKELRDAHIESKQKAMEFSLLQSQLSPHFLFNVLNSLYGISLEEQHRVPSLLLKLSSLLRYSVYGARKTFVPLQEELDYINDYIEFEKIRTGDRLTILADIEKVADPAVKIAPMVLIVFIENAFKHAKNSSGKKIFIMVSLRVLDGVITFVVANSYEKEQPAESTPGGSSGLGLANTVKRLDLLYGANYVLKKGAGNGEYTVRLTLNFAT